MFGWVRAAVAALLLASAATVQAQPADWPSKPVRVIVPFAPGGSNDNIARPIADGLSQATGQQWVIDNKGGAGGAIGTEAAAKAPPDGYTFLIGPSGSMTIIPHLRKAPYARDDLVPIARLGTYVAGLAVNPAVPATNLKELVALAKAKPGSLSFGLSGVGAVSHIRVEILKLSAGIEINHVPYRGGAEALNDLLAGHVQIQTENIVFPHVKAGKLRMLAMISDERHPDFPDVPTVGEQGYPEMNVPLWYGLFAPAGIPQGIVDRLHAECVRILKQPEMGPKLVSLGFSLAYESPAELKQVLAREDAQYAKVIKDAKISNE